MNAMDHVPELRSALANREPAKAARTLLGAKGLVQWADLHRYAVGCDPGVLAPRRCLEVVDAYHRGEVTREHVAQARAAAYAADASYAADAYAAYAADAHQMWHDDWTWHLLRHVLEFDEPPPPAPVGSAPVGLADTVK